MPLAGPRLYRGYMLLKNKNALRDKIKSALKGIPLLWPAARWGYALLRLPQLKDQLIGETQRLNHLIFIQEKQLIDLEKKSAERQRVLQDELSRLKKQYAEWREDMMTLVSQPATVAPPSAGQDRVVSPALQVLLDRYYLDFENAFRGSRADIKQRLEAYLPFIQSIPLSAGRQVLDIGCGRGEWLELMAEQGFTGLGIDINERMVEATRQAGQRAERADALAWLQRCPPGTLAVISAFHVIEHLPFEDLLLLFSQALRALRPGGLIIFETPNPENLQVGAFTFYNDPTHRNPIPPAVAAFMAQQSGFARTHIERLHPYPETALHAEDSESARALVKLCMGAQDYALLAWKKEKE